MAIGVFPGSVGAMKGVSEGVSVGASVGNSVGSAEGSLVGSAEGSLVGSADGSLVGSAVGVSDGVSVGASDGATEGGAHIQSLSLFLLMAELAEGRKIEGRKGGRDRRKGRGYKEGEEDRKEVSHEGKTAHDRADGAAQQPRSAMHRAGPQQMVLWRPSRCS